MHILGRSIAAAVQVALAALLIAGGPAQAQMLAPLGPLENGRVSFFIAEPPAGVELRPGDAELAVWALKSWQRAAGGALEFVRTEDEDEALVRLYWAPASGGQYGEMRPIEVEGRRGAAVYVRPDTAALGADIAARAQLDALFRDTVVYLTCLHELGHALGLAHTADFGDVMYFFGFGGDITEFFARYRRMLAARDDIAGTPGLSQGDLEALEALYRLAGAAGELTVAN